MAAMIMCFVDVSESKQGMYYLCITYSNHNFVNVELQSYLDN